MKLFIIIYFIALYIPVPASVTVFLAGPPSMTVQLDRYNQVLKNKYPKSSTIRTGTNLAVFEKGYRNLIISSQSGDTILMIWIGHTGLTNDSNYRGGACFILSEKKGSDIDINNEIFGFDAINIMADWLTAHYGYRVVMIFETCYAGLLASNFKYNDKITMLLATGARQENLFWPEQNIGWFSKILLEHIKTVKSSRALINIVNANYKNKEVYSRTFTPTRNKQPIDYYPFTAMHLGNDFNFK